MRETNILKNLISTSGNLSLHFFRTLIRMKAVFRSSKIAISTSPSFLLAETDYLLTANLVLLFRAFFCCWTPFLTLKVDEVLKNIIPAL